MKSYTDDLGSKLESGKTVSVSLAACNGNVVTARARILNAARAYGVEVVTELQRTRGRILGVPVRGSRKRAA